MQAQAVEARQGRVTAVDLAMVSVAVIWGVNASVVKTALAGWDPLAFNAIRFGAAGVLLFVYVMMTDRNWRLERRDFWAVAGLGLVGNGLYQWLFIEAISRTTASNTALILAVSPLLVTLWGAVVKTDRITAWVAGGTAVSVGGVALVILGQHGGFHFGGTTFIGDLIALISMICWAAYTVYARPVIQRVGSSLRVTAWAMMFGAITNMIVGAGGLLRQDYTAITSASVWGMIYSGLLSLVFSYVVYAWAVQRVGGTRTAIYLNLVPVLAALVAWIWLGEQWAPLQWLGAVLVIGGVTVAKLEGARSS